LHKSGVDETVDQLFRHSVKLVDLIIPLAYTYSSCSSSKL